ncbi:hypothetical protein [Gordonia crocea]|uniref:Serine hydrolase n=1 Tax=Gordonia crocea TaxID=589162 RepID=A0A7I9UWE7_9ACTN|nr:hypothetical protein [Gordonia crocea]GED97101.1 hypothetical protein nbrc107697_11400 [Gordonia crocea]
MNRSPARFLAVPVALAIATAIGLTAAGCGGEERQGEEGRSESSPSVSPPASSVPSSVSRSAPRPAPGPPMSAAIPALAAAYGDLNKALADVGANQKVALAILPVGRPAEPIVFGDIDPPQVAWSSIKVALAVAAERHHGGPMPATVAAITASDNAAAQSLWRSLGDDRQAAAAVTRVLREGGDDRTTVPAVAKRPPYSIFGQTVWPVANAARFTAGFACLPDAGRVRTLMGRVDGNQRWGADKLKSKTEVKGGWGPGRSSGYVVRQIAVITHRDGSQTAVAMVTFGTGTTMATGTTALDHVGVWLSRNARNLPRGFC